VLGAGPGNACIGSAALTSCRRTASTASSPLAQAETILLVTAHHAPAGVTAGSSGRVVGREGSAAPPVEREAATAPVTVLRYRAGRPLLSAMLAERRSAG